MKKSIVAIFLLVIFLSGCAPRIYIHSQIDPEYSFTKRTISIVPYNNLSLTQKRLRDFLIKELIDLNFELIHPLNAYILRPQLVLFFEIREKTSRIDTYKAVPDWATIFGSIGDTDLNITEYKTTIVPDSFDYTVQKIYLTLYDVEDPPNDTKTPVWEGYMGAGKEKYDEFPEACVEKLLEYYGKDFRGHIRISPK